MRVLTEAVRGNELVSVELELIVDKLGAMGGTPGCGTELWNKVRDAATTAVDEGLRAAAAAADGSNGTGATNKPPAVAAGPIPVPPALPLPKGAVPAPPPLPPPPVVPIPRAPGPPRPGPIPMAPPGVPPIPKAPPPPPPLPPGMKGLPVLLGPPGLPRKVAVRTGPKRRGIYWTKIKAGIKGTVFEEIKGAEVDVPKAFLLEGFEEKPMAPKKVGEGSRSAGGGGGSGGSHDANEGGKAGAGGPNGEEEDQKKKKPAPEPLLGAKALQYGIVFKTVSVKPETVRDAVMSMDLSFLNPDTLEKLGKLQPPPAELATLKAFKGGLSELVEVEQFMVLASRIPSYETRLRCADIMQSFAPDVEYTMDRLKVVDEAITQVTTSDKLKRLLAVVLAVGNFLNEGSGVNGDAEAITLESLLKLVTVRRPKKRALVKVGDDTLVHSLLEWASEAEPSLLLLGEDLQMVASASRLSLEDLKKEVHTISKDLKVLEAKLEEEKKRQAGGKGVPGDKFVGTVEPFLADVKGTLENLKSELGRIEKAYSSAATKFGEDPLKTPSEAFFGLIKNIVQMIDVGARENQERAEAEASRIKRANRELKRRKEKKEALEARQASEVNIQSLLLDGVNRMRGMATGMVNVEYDRIKEERAKENEAFREMSETVDAGKREHMRDQLRYQRSTTAFGPSLNATDMDQQLRPNKEQRQIQSSYRSASIVNRAAGQSGSSSKAVSALKLSASSRSGRLATHERKASALRQASLIRQNTVLQRASLARSGSDLNSSGVHDRGGSSTNGGGGGGVGGGGPGPGARAGDVGRGTTGRWPAQQQQPPPAAASNGGGGGSRDGGGGGGGGDASGLALGGKSSSAVKADALLSAGGLSKLRLASDKSAFGRRSRTLHIPPDDDADGDQDDGDDSSESPMLSRSAMSKRLAGTRGTRTLGGNRRGGPIG